MNPNSLLTSAGLAATVVLGGFAIYLAVRYSRAVAITYLEDTCLSLIDDVTQGIRDLEIKFRNSPVSQNLVLLRGYIFNSGKRDIAPSMVERPLRLVLPQGFGWIDCQITGRANNLRVGVASLTAESIEFELGLFKIEEYFKFDALATVPIHDDVKPKGAAKPPDVKLRGALKFDYRIVDARDIRKLRLRDLQTARVSPAGRAHTTADRRLPVALRVFSRASMPFALGFIMVLVGVAIYFVLVHMEPRRIGY